MPGYGAQGVVNRRELLAMTRYSRSVIPGRPKGEDGGDIDRLVFGKGGVEPAAAPTNEGEPDFLPPAEVSDLIDRANTDRRKIKRRKNDFAPLPEEGRAFKAEEGAKRGPMLLVGSLVIVAVFGVVVWNAYRDGVKPENSDDAIQLASAGAFKSKPEDGKTKPKADVQAGVFDQIEKTKPLAAPAPEFREPPATPKSQLALAGETAQAPTAKAEAAKPEAAKPEIAKAETASADPTPPARPAAVKIGPPSQAKTASNPAPAAALVPPPKPAAAAVKPSAAPVAPVAVKAVARAEPPKPQPAAASSVEFKPAFTKDGGFVVQVAAPSSEEGAEAEWTKRVKAAPDLFATAEKIIVKADVNGRTVYRLRAGSFATPADAEAFCTAYKAKGGACFRTAK